MEEFYQTRERVAFCCNGEKQPDMEDYVVEKTQETFNRIVKSQVLPDGTKHGKTVTTLILSSYCKENYRFGVLRGTWEKSNFFPSCEGNFLNGIPDGIFSIREWSPDEQHSIIVYRNGKAVSHSYDGKGDCGLRCRFENEGVFGPHSLSWSFQGNELLVKFKKGIHGKNITKRIKNLRKQSLRKKGETVSTVFCNSDILPKEVQVFYHGEASKERQIVLP